MNILKIAGVVILLIIVMKLLWTITYKLIGIFVVLVLGVVAIKLIFPNLLKGKND